MSIIVEANYSKRIGLPKFSSHTFDLTVRTELADLAQLDTESHRLYALLQAAVDREIQSAGYVPGEDTPAPTNGTNGHGPNQPDASVAGWQCSGRQRELILTIAEERQVPLARVEQLSQESFSKELRQLKRAEASRLITRLLTT